MEPRSGTLHGGARPVVTTPWRRAYRIGQQARPGNSRCGEMRYDYAMGILYLLLPYLLQGTAIVHCIKTGRNSLWIWAIALLPLAGPIAYVLIELLPSLFGSRGTRRAVRGVRKVLDPEQDLRRFQDEARLIGDVASRQRFADELVRQGRAQEAIDIYRQALTGLYEQDPNLLLGLARAQFAGAAYSEARATLDALIGHNPEFKSPDGHLLYARALEGEGDIDKALEEYAAVSKYYAGAEAPLRYARLLRASGKPDQARRAFDNFQRSSRDQSVDPFVSVGPYLGIGDTDQALATLEKSVTAHSPGLTALKVDPIFDPLRTAPRFQSLLRRVGLSPSAQ